VALASNSFLARLSIGRPAILNVDRSTIQNCPYLNEFTLRFNRRFYPFNAFRSLLGIAGGVTAPTSRRLSGRPAQTPRTVVMSDSSSSTQWWSQSFRSRATRQPPTESIRRTQNHPDAKIRTAVTGIHFLCSPQIRDIITCFKFFTKLVDRAEWHMAFRAKRVRIQIPCGSSGSILEAGCDAGCSDSPQSAVCPPPAMLPPPPDPPCGVPSHFFGLNPWDEIINPAEQFLLSSEDLPLFKQELELKMKVLELADDATALAKKRVQTKLADIASVEKKLEKGSNN
jgi:hypothetical protein